jgi:hypothetical protein
MSRRCRWPASETLNNLGHASMSELSLLSAVKRTSPASLIKSGAPFAPAAVRIEFINYVLPSDDLILEPDPAVR